MSVHRVCLSKKRILFKLDLLESIRNSYGNIKAALWKFLNVVAIIR